MSVLHSNFQVLYFNSSLGKQERAHVAYSCSPVASLHSGAVPYLLAQLLGKIGTLLHLLHLQRDNLTKQLHQQVSLPANLLLECWCFAAMSSPPVFIGVLLQVQQYNEIAKQLRQQVLLLLNSLFELLSFAAIVKSHTSTLFLLDSRKAEVAYRPMSSSLSFTEGLQSLSMSNIVKQ